MSAEDGAANGFYCPFNGFNPPCWNCMLAVQEAEDSLACAIATIAIKDTTLFVRNIAKVVE